MENKIYVDQSGNYLGEYSIGNIAIPDGAVEVASRPDDAGKIYDFDSDSWDYSLQDAKDKKITEIKALRKSNLLKSTPQTITYSGNLENKTFNINENDIDKFTTIIASLQDDIDNGAVNPTRNWSDETGERLSLDINDFKSLRKHLNIRDEQEFDQARLKIEALELLETIEEIEAFDITQIIV